jgi:ArsR family transcriptional regulator
MDPDTFHRIAKALADPRRFDILERIASVGELPCQSLSAQLPISRATLSHHLQELESASLIAVRKEGKFAHLSLNHTIWRAYRRELKRRIG